VLLIDNNNLAVLIVLILSFIIVHNKLSVASNSSYLVVRQNKQTKL